MLPSGQIALRDWSLTLGTAFGFEVKVREKTLRRKSESKGILHGMQDGVYIKAVGFTQDCQCFLCSSKVKT